MTEEHHSTTISVLLSPLPALLRKEVESLWQDYLIQAGNTEGTMLQPPAQILASLPVVWACSPYVAKYCIRHPQLFNELCQSNDLLTPPQNYPPILHNLLENVEDDAVFMRMIRRFRQREMVRIAWRDLAGWATLNETFYSLSHLADSLIAAALDYTDKKLCIQLGTPCNEQGIPQKLVVLAMGKLGGQELNFSSDIDLIFTYPEAGNTVGTTRSRTNQEFFIRLGQQLINALNHVNEEGFVFRVDMRLRPFGDSGPLAMHFAAIEEYYQSHARDWERYALVKARVAAGDKTAGESLLNTLKPFIYRRYLDYGAFEALRTMKELIDQETHRRGLEHNIKLGAGGIREAEFVCQVFQLIRGGRQPALQQKHFLTTLEQLEKYRCLSTEEVAQLRAAYEFLRTTENHLQAIDDRQTQNLPEDELNRTRLIFSLGFTQWPDFVKQLDYHLQNVQTQFKQIIAPPPSDNKTIDLSEQWETLWAQGLQDQEQTLAFLTKTGFQDAQLIFNHLHQFLLSHKVQKMSVRGRERLDKLIPLMFTAVLEYEQPDKTLHRVLDLIEATAQRSVYLALLLERSQVLRQLVRLCAHSEWVAVQITRYPLLLDELLDQRRLYDPLKPEELGNALQAQLAHLPVDDLEIQMDCLRQFKRAQVLHVASAELEGNLTVEVASDYLAAIADTLLHRSLSMAWDHLVERYGRPTYLDNQGEKQYAGFCIVAYGKAGGVELSYGSDLDIVFLHNSQGTQQLTEGERPVENNVFFNRLAQRIIHILTTNTPAGVLYQVDSRLRPGGASGLMVSHFAAFIKYQYEDAWTWEHQALVRARAVVGDEECMKQFEDIRRDILSLPRDHLMLKREVREMREKMLENLDKSTAQLFDIKQASGGITDIEFIVQYGVLRWAVRYSELLDTTATLPSLRLFAQLQLLDGTACQQLSQAYRLYRKEVHRLTLQNQSFLVPRDKFKESYQQVQHWWNVIMRD